MKSKEILLSLTLLVVGSYFFIVGIIEASGFLKPLSIAVLLTLICIPFCRKLESWRLSRGISALVSVILSLLVFISFFTIITAQIANISERWPEIQRKMQPKLEEVKEFQMLYPASEVESSSNSENEKQSSSSASQGTSAESSPKEMVSNASEEIGMIVMNFFNFMSGAVLTLVYLFFLLLYRNKVKLSVLKFFSKANRKEAEEVMNHSIELALNFIVGRVILIAFLAVIYSIGLSLSGIENAILISVIAAILSLVPFIGNIIGYGLSLVMAVFAGAELWGIVGVSITFGLAQFIESYILEPYVVGSKVEVNPLITIVVVILGGAIWGIVGMILSIPIAGICKIIFDLIPALQPIGYALGEKDVEGADEENFLSRWGKKLWEKVSK